MLNIPPSWVKDQIYWPDNQPASGRKRATILSNCTGRGLGDYLLANHHFRKHFILDRLETAPIMLSESKGVPIVGTKEFAAIINSADLLITNNTGERHGSLALREIERFVNDRCAVITFVATNFGAFWPIAYGYGGMIGVFNMLDSGATRNDVWKSLEQGTFDPLFRVRWRLEMGRLADRETFHDIGFSRFVMDHHKKNKLFMAQSHPSGNTIAYIGAKILEKIGLQHDSIETILSYECTKFSVSGQPETQYEFAHYGFQYPMRFTDKFSEYYGALLDVAIKAWKDGGFISPAHDA